MPTRCLTPAPTPRRRPCGRCGQARNALAEDPSPRPSTGQLFAAAERLECTWVLNEAWLPYQRLELECDLIGSHLLVLGTVSAAQFIG